MRLLTVDDDKTLLHALDTLLKENGYLVDGAADLREARACLERYRYDLLVLDWLLPDGDGVEWLRQIRRDGFELPVLLLSSKDRPIDKATALDAGADDYLQKPFSNIELSARIRALLRREATQKRTQIEIGPLFLDSATHVVKVRGETVELSAKEFDLLYWLALHAGTVLTRYQLLERIRSDYDFSPSSNIVDAHIKNLRKKLGEASLIETVRGIGYRIPRK